VLLNVRDVPTSGFFVDQRINLQVGHLSVEQHVDFINILCVGQKGLSLQELSDVVLTDVVLEFFVDVLVLQELVDLTRVVLVVSYNLLSFLCDELVVQICEQTVVSVLVVVLYYVHQNYLVQFANCVYFRLHRMK